MKTSGPTRTSVGSAGELLDGASADFGTLRARHESAKRRYAGSPMTCATPSTARHLSDRYVTQRASPVLPVKAASKRQFGGAVHDASRSGKTAYVEPAQLEALKARRRCCARRRATDSRALEPVATPINSATTSILVRSMPTVREGATRPLMG